jgi:hypothetical protein
MLLPVRVGLGVAGIVYGFWSLWLAVLESRSAPLHFNPLVTYEMWQMATLGLSPIFIALTYSAVNPVPIGPKLVGVEQVGYGHAILVVGAFALYLGMKQFQPRDVVATSGAKRKVPFLMLSIGFIAGLVIQVFSPEITGAVGSVFACLSFMAVASLLLFAIEPPTRYWRSPGPYWAILLAGTSALLLVNARDTSKMMVVFSFVPFVLAIRKRLSTGATIAFGAGSAVAYLFLLTPLATITRARVQVNELGERSMLHTDTTGDVLTRLVSSFRDDQSQYLSSWFGETLGRLGDSVPAGFIADSVATNGSLNGMGMGYVPLAFVPRILWHDKPLIVPGSYFTTVLGGASDKSLVSTSTGQTAAGELFWNFGWPGVVIGMYLLGVTLSGAWWGADRGNPTNGVLEMTAFLGATLSFVQFTGGAAGPAFTGAISVGIFLRVLIRVRDRMFLRRRGYWRRVIPGVPKLPTCR